MSEAANRGLPLGPLQLSQEAGAVAVEYLLILGFITAMVIVVLGLLYPGAGRDIESRINALGRPLAEDIAGGEMRPYRAY